MIADDLTGVRVAVWGTGSEGTAFARLLRERGGDPLLVDDRPSGPDVVLPEVRLLRSVDVVVRSPGVCRYRPELIDAARHGVEVTTPMALWLAEMAGRPVLAVTGTKGKSTTATLAAAILRGAGLEVALAGNIGTPVTELTGDAGYDAYVVEVSSYQAADVTVGAAATVLTRLAPDHLDWHGGIEAYYRDKLRLVTTVPDHPVAVPTSSAEAMARTSGLAGRVLYGGGGRVVVAGSRLVLDGEEVADLGRFRAPGAHNATNAAGALTGAVLLAGPVPPPAVAAALDGFDPLPSRSHPLGERGGLVFVDDALASNPSATAATLAAFDGRAVGLIVGGADRGVDLGPLAAAVGQHRGELVVAAVPPAAGRFAEALDAARPGLVTSEVRGIDEAVALLVASVPAGGAVLFSPAAPTPDGEGGYRARAARFAAAAGLARGGPEGVAAHGAS